MKLIGKFMMGLIGTTMKLVIGAVIVIFVLCLYGNVQDSKDDYRNYNMDFSWEDGIEVSYQIPVEQVLEESIEDTLYTIDGFIGTIATNF